MFFSKPLDSEVNSILRHNEEQNTSSAFQGEFYILGTIPWNGFWKHPKMKLMVMEKQRNYSWRHLCCRSWAEAIHMFHDPGILTAQWWQKTPNHFVRRIFAIPSIGKHALAPSILFQGTSHVIAHSRGIVWMCRLLILDKQFGCLWTM